jgi:hypothetical protein
MKYTVIFTLGYIDDEEAIYRGNRGDILILDELGSYYHPYFTVLESIRGEFMADRVCYTWDKMVIVHELTTKNILKSITELHIWQFQKNWMPLTNEQIEKYFFPKENWITYDVEVDG